MNTPQDGRALPRELQLAAQQQLRRFFKINPLGANLLVGQLVFLLALSYGAGDVAMGLLYGGVWLSGPAALVMPAMCARKDPARLAAETWLVRSLICLGYLAVPFLPDDGLKVAVLVTIYLSFAIFRTISASALNVAIAAYAEANELTGVVATSHMWWHVGTLAVTVVSTAVLAIWSSELSYFGLIILGIALSAAAAVSMRSLPAVGRYHGARLLSELPLVLRDRGVRGALAATMLVMPQSLAAAYQLSVLKGPMHMPAERIFALTLVGLTLAIAATRLLGKILPHTGLRPVQLAAHVVLSLLGLAWATSGAVPETWRAPWCMGLYVVAQALLAVSGVILAAIQFDRLPVAAPLTASALYQATGAAAVLFGIVLIWGASHLGLERLPGAGPYAHTFLVWALCSAGVCTLHLATGGVATVLKDLKLLSLANVIGVWTKPVPTKDPHDD